MPSAPQKRFIANGRSFDTQRTTVFASAAAFWLKVRTDVAQTPVSMLGKMLSTTFLPVRSFLASGDRSTFVSVKSGAWLPTFGSSPDVATGLPLNVILAMGVRGWGAQV